MNVYDNLAFPLRMRKHSKSGIDERVRQVAELLRITELFTRKPKQLCGGQQQRVALGRALVREPKVFLMDEPLRNLDAKMRLYMRTELKVLQKRLGITTIYVTHDNIIKVNAPPSLKVSPGSSVWLSFKANDMHVFDKKTGKALI